MKGAAERLGVTQPTVSEQLRMLERTLAVQLFERTPSGLKLTQPGRDAYEHTTAMFIAGERLVEALGHRVEPIGVTLRVGVSAATACTMAADFLMPVLTVDNCRPSIRNGDFNELLRDLRSQELDLVVGETEPLDALRTGLEVKLIHRSALIAVASPGLQPTEDWNNLSLLEYRTTSAYHWEVEKYLREHGLHPKLMGELDDAFLMLEAVIRGGFVAFLPQSVAYDAVTSGKVKTLLTLDLQNAGVYAVYPEGTAIQLARIAVEKLIENTQTRFTLF